MWICTGSVAHGNGLQSVVEVGGSNERVRYDRVGRVPVATEDVAGLFAQMEVVTPIKAKLKRWLSRREEEPGAASAPRSA